MTLSPSRAVAMAAVLTAWQRLVAERHGMTVPWSRLEALLLDLARMVELGNVDDVEGAAYAGLCDLLGETA